MLVTVLIPLLLVLGTFDVVIIAGALDTGFVPVSVVRELCQATKPGNLLTDVTLRNSLYQTRLYFSL